MTVGNRVDSYYEYLLKQWLLSNQTEPTYLSDYNQAMRGVQKHLVSVAGPYTFVGELENWGKFSASMDHLGCFLPGLLALGHSTGAAESNNDLELAEKLMFTCFNFYNQSKSKMSPETVVFEKDSESSEDEATPAPPLHQCAHHTLSHLASTQRIQSKGPDAGSTRRRRGAPKTILMWGRQHTLGNSLFIYLSTRTSNAQAFSHHK